MWWRLKAACKAAGAAPKLPHYIAERSAVLSGRKSHEPTALRGREKKKGPTIGPGIQAEPIAAAAINPIIPVKGKLKGGLHMAFFNSAVGVLQTLVVALGAGLGIWGAINLLEGYGNDNPGANAHVR